MVKISLTRNLGIGLLVAISFATVFMQYDEAASRVPYVRQCTGKDPGSWAFGEASDGCDAFRFGDVARMKYIYEPFVFDRSKAEDPETRRNYVTNVSALLRDLATDYIRARDPNVRDDEIKAFVNAIQAVAHQETFWSHYRISTKGSYKLATGDSYRSHGMMQINQRYHASKEQDRSFDLVGNVSFGIEHYYSEWETASRARCIHRSKKQTRAQTLENIARAAYSAYNGGPGAICRWTNPRHAWAKNDKNFLKKLKDRDWSEWVQDEDRKLEINLQCIRAGDELCAVAKERRGEFLSSRALMLSDGSSCVTTDGRSLHCAQDARVFTCLAGLSPEVASQSPLMLSADDPIIRAMSKKFYDNRLELCRGSFPEMASVGDVLTTKVSLAVRADIGGKTVGFAKKGQSFQVLDLEVDLDESSERHYRVRLPNKREGWISVGDRLKSEKLATIEHLGFSAPPAGVSNWLPTIGSQVEVARAGGVKLLVAPEKLTAAAKDTPEWAFKSEVKTILAKGTRMTVESVDVVGAANEIWLRVQVGSGVGYVYAGRTFPSITVDQWVKVK